MTTIQQWLDVAVKNLQYEEVQTARLDALVLLEDTLDKDRSWVLAHQEDQISSEHVNRLNNAIERRKRHEPLAYIRGKAEFYGREFIVNDDVLVPRPESEALIELLKANIINYPATHIVDIGTGSGCLAITAKLELPGADLIATDISKKALEVAEANARHHNAPIQFFQGDLLEPALAHVNNESYGLLCNLPYVPTKYEVNRAAQQEPSVALFGGDDGLDLFRKLFAQIHSAQTKPSFIISESLPEQHATLSKLAAKHSFTTVMSEDFAQLFVSHD